MSLQRLKTANFGSSKAGAAVPTGVGYTLLDEFGAIQVVRSTAGVYEAASGIYSALITFPDEFSGTLLWDTGSSFTPVAYAAEDVNARLEESIEVVRDMTEGRWQIINNQMIFYAADNVTEVARFNLYDNSNVPSMDAVFHRTRV